jgi:peptidoglycan/xylan/chitin deacetylase (PgdA/CDA1 family)
MLIRPRVLAMRRRVARARMCCERHLLPSLPTDRPLTGGRILCYHGVGTPQWGVNDITPQRFEQHLRAALAEGFRFVPAAELAEQPQPQPGRPPDTLAAGRTQPTAPDRRLAITFDDGLRSVLTAAAPALRELGIPWTLFVVTDWAEGDRPEEADLLLDWHDIAALAESGVTIGSHSVTHPDFGRLSPGRAAEELGRSREIIRDRLGIDPREFAAPLGQSANWFPGATRAVFDAGYRTVYAQSQDRRPQGTVGRTFVTRFDTDRIFRAALRGAFDRWEEWI